MAVVRLESLTKRFGNVVAVNNLSLEVKDGEFVSFLGPSGCGKTTTLRMIAGVERPTDGKIYIDDVVVNDLPSKDRDIAMVFQFYVMYPAMKVFDQIAFPLKMRGASKDEIKKSVREVATILGIDHLLDFPVGGLTMGERQRIELARAMVRRPKVYLLDEPLTNLDAKLRGRMRGELKRLIKTLRTTTIYVTHDQLEAISMADRIAVMTLGSLQQYDTPENMYDHPTNLFVAGFIGTPAINFVDCSFVEKDGRAFLDAGEFVYDITEFRENVAKDSTSPELILGIRPEHILVNKQRAGENSIRAQVNVVEPTGNRTIVRMSVGKHPMVANTGVLAISPDEKVWISFDRTKIHIFDKKTERMII